MTKINVLNTGIQLSGTQNNCGAITITATTPLLNLNLNYEKLQHKDTEI